MVIDSLFQKRSQNLPIYLQMYPPPPPGVHLPEPKCHLDLTSNFFIPGGGGHQPEPKCHLDLKLENF